MASSNDDLLAGPFNDPLTKQQLEVVEIPRDGFCFSSAMIAGKSEYLKSSGVFTRDELVLSLDSWLLNSNDQVWDYLKTEWPIFEAVMTQINESLPAAASTRLRCKRKHSDESRDPDSQAVAETVDKQAVRRYLYLCRSDRNFWPHIDALILLTMLRFHMSISLLYVTDGLLADPPMWQTLVPDEDTIRALQVIDLAPGNGTHICLLYHQGVHYDLLMPVNETEKCDAILESPKA